MTPRNVVIPEGVTEIDQGAFSSCMFLETVSFPKLPGKIGNFAFMSCRNMKRVEFAEDLEELGDHAFGETNNLKEVHFPESLKKVNRNVFGIGGGSFYATAYLSGKCPGELPGNLRAPSGDRRQALDGMEEYISSMGASD